MLYNIKHIATNIFTYCESQTLLFNTESGFIYTAFYVLQDLGIINLCINCILNK
jgi:hypothetical protein